MTLFAILSTALRHFIDECWTEDGKENLGYDLGPEKKALKIFEF